MSAARMARPLTPRMSVTTRVSFTLASSRASFRFHHPGAPASITYSDRRSQTGSCVRRTVALSTPPDRGFGLGRKGPGSYAGLSLSIPNGRPCVAAVSPVPRRTHDEHLAVKRLSPARVEHDQVALGPSDAQQRQVFIGAYIGHAKSQRIKFACSAPQRPSC